MFTKAYTVNGFSIEHINVFQRMMTVFVDAQLNLTRFISFKKEKIPSIGLCVDCYCTNSQANLLYPIMIVTKWCILRCTNSVKTCFFSFFLFQLENNVVNTDLGEILTSHSRKPKKRKRSAADFSSLYRNRKL